MMVKRNISILSVPVFLVLASLFLFVNTCKKFEPEGFLHVTTSTTMGVTSNSAYIGGGVIVGNGEASVESRGVCWSTSSNPTIADNSTSEGTGTGTFASEIKGLNPRVKYYTRAFASNNSGTTYGEELEFTTLDVENATVNDADGNVYNAIQIGDQIWMKENLKTTKYADGTSLHYIDNGPEWTDSELNITAYCWYDNSTENRDNYGGLYAWGAAMRGAGGSNENPSGIQGVCPDGWHLPSNAEWIELEVFLGMTPSVAQDFHREETTEGGKMKEAGSEHWVSPNPGATNSSGFSALPAGTMGYEGSRRLGQETRFWSTSAFSESAVFARALLFNSEAVYQQEEGKDAGLSVRCIKGEVNSISPEVTTLAIKDFTSNSATGGGEVTSDGGVGVIARGVCWSTSKTPSITDDTTLNGGGIGSFESSLTGLTPGTSYYVRAYATNGIGTSYGVDVSFETNEATVSVIKPTVLTTEVSEVAETTAMGGGEVTADGGAEVTARGVCWSSSPRPTIADASTTDGAGTGSYTSSIYGLNSGVTYYIRAFASNSKGTNYGDEIIIRTKTSSGATVKDYDGNVYPTLQIGNQEWMIENLNVTHYPDGTAILVVEDSISWDGLGPGDQAYCWYDNSSLQENTYGALYTWEAAMKGGAGSDALPSGVQGVCPDGMHLPSDSEWKQLEMFLGMDQAEADKPGGRGTDEGNKLKEAGTDHWKSPNTGATNEAGFTVLPGGSRSHSGSFENIGERAYFWTATEESGIPWTRSFFYDIPTSNRNKLVSYFGFSVRCVGN
jgi:uncharacterized protein (TIGR02145 family)